MRTPICDMLGIELPIFAFTHCRDVVVAVAKAGGFGVLGAVGFPPDQLEVELKWIDEHIGDRPYGVDIVIPGKYEGMGEIDPVKLEQQLQAERDARGQLRRITRDQRQRGLGHGLERLEHDRVDSLPARQPLGERCRLRGERVHRDHALALGCDRGGEPGVFHGQVPQCGMWCDPSETATFFGSRNTS